MSIKVARISDSKMCPICHEGKLVEPQNDKSFALVELDSNKEITNNFIAVKVMRCPECGAIFTFEAK